MRADLIGRSILTIRPFSTSTRGSLTLHGCLLATEPRIRRVLVNPSAPSRRQISLERHGETGWYEWTLRELLRYFFGLGILALLVFIPLQMEVSWVPSNSPAVLDPALVPLFALTAVVVIGVLAFLAYRSVWGDNGRVERRLARYRSASHSVEEDTSESRRSRD